MSALSGTISMWMCGADTRNRSHKRGNSTSWLMSVMHTRKVRCELAGSNAWWWPSTTSSAVSASRTGRTRPSPKGVGSMPAEVRTKRGSPKWRRNLDNATLTAGWLMSSTSAAPDTLRVL